MLVPTGHHGRDRFFDFAANRQVFLRHRLAVDRTGDIDDRLDVIDDGADGQRDAAGRNLPAR